MSDNPPQVQDLGSVGTTDRAAFAVLPREGESISKRRDARPDYKIDPDTGCWIWQKTLDRKGYGKISPSRLGTHYAYRVYWMIANGPLEPGMGTVIDHLCRNPACVNPKHLEAVSQATNVHRGIAAKLTMEIAREVRRMVKAGHTGAEITEATGVTTQNIWWIAEDKAWREDPDAPREPVYPERDCAWCETPVPPERGRRALYCSLECKRRAAKARCK